MKNKESADLIAQMTDQELLKMRLCDLPLSIQDWSGLALWQAQLRLLQRRGLRVEPMLWLSTDWFCPDGVVGVAVPFYLAHPRLLKLQRRLGGEVEGQSPQQCLRLLRHELGHAIDNAFRLRRRRERQRLFGSSLKKYPEHYRPQKYSRAFVSNIGHGYAQSHPDEDFAETFAVWLGPKADWRKKYALRPRALEKLEWMNNVLNELRDLKPPVKNQRPLEPIWRCHQTLRQYYNDQARRQKRREELVVGSDIKATYGPHREGLCFRSLLHKKKSQLTRDVARNLGQPVYRVEWVFNLVDKGAAASQAKYSGDPRQFVGEVRDLLTQYALEYLPKDRDHVIM